MFQEIEALRDAYGGMEIAVRPVRDPATRFPRSLVGLHCLPQLRAGQAKVVCNHIHYPVLHAFPFLRLLQKPVVFTVTASLNPDKLPSGRKFLAGLRRIVVSNERDLRTLKDWGFANASLVMPGIDLSRANGEAKPMVRKNDGTFRLLMASAPWAERQFDLKGVDSLLQALVQQPDLRLTLLWRGHLRLSLQRRLDAFGLGDRVEVIDGYVDIAPLLAWCDAAILLAKRADIVKAWPHSLVEALAARRPVIVSNTIPMADFIAQTGMGEVTPDTSVEAVLAAVDRLRGREAEVREKLAGFDEGLFSQAAMIEAYRPIYGL